MKPDRIAVAVALAFAFAADVSAATSCVQNKSTGKYEPRTPTAESIAACAAMNKTDTTAIAAPTAPQPPAAVPNVAAPSAALPATPAATMPTNRSVAAVVLDQQPTPVKAPPDTAQQARTYTLKTSDVTVRLALKRWMKEANMQLAYEAAEEFNVSVEGSYTGTIPEVMFKLMTSLKQSKYPLRTCEYDNRVVLVVHRDEVCPLEDE
jgi:hypothetical protein